MNYKEKWKAMSKFHKILKIIHGVFAIVIIMLYILALIKIMDIDITTTITMFLAFIITAINGVDKFKANRAYAYFCFALSGLLFIDTIIIYSINF